MRRLNVKAGLPLMASALAHGFAVAGAGAMTARGAAPPTDSARQASELFVIEAEPSARPGESTKQPASPETAPRREMKAKVERSATMQATAAATEAPAQASTEAPLDLSQMLLSNAAQVQGGAWALPGSERGGSRYGRGGRGNASAAQGSGIDSERILPLGQLSRRPIQPTGLDRLLQRFYPKAASRQGIEGTAMARVRVLSSGQLEVLSAHSDVLPEFASACARTLRASPRWRSALGPKGQRVATELDFPCRFRLR